ncbi:MAG: ferrous iron transport protein B, partial [Pyrinomonadaceae bacterium]
MNLVTESVQPYTRLPITKRALTIALAGNPNAGKTSLFNSLTGLRQKVANYPGVTVERKEGFWLLDQELPPARLVDLPGLYSLDASAPDEQIAHDVITGKTFGMPEPDCIIAVADATNLERNLYLVTQLMEFHRPLVIALTMVDLAEKTGVEVKADELSIALGIPVVPVVAAERKGLDELSRQVIIAAQKESSPTQQWELSQIAESEISSLIETSANKSRSNTLRELYGDELPRNSNRREIILAARSRLAEGSNEWWQEPLRARYAWIENAVHKSVSRKNIHDRSLNERIDRILTHRFFGPIILIAVMLLIFQLIFTWAQLPMDMIDHGFAELGSLLHSELPRGLLTDLLADGIVAGVGAVLVFLPQIILLFFFITILEDTGYMARAAFLMDRLMRGVGLHGKAFLPLISSFACAIPGIMATRTIENPKDRLATIMIAPFMSCSARLPIYT